MGDAVLSSASMQPVRSDKVYIVLVNYNGWFHTLECIESLLKLHYSNFQIVIVDNGSTDGSIDHFRLWAEGMLNVWVRDDNPLKALSMPSCAPPFPYLLYQREEAESGGNRKSENNMDGARYPGSTNCRLPIILILARSNLGYTGGNNLGMRYALGKGDADFVWLINNDTVVDPESLGYMVDKFRERPVTAAVGSVHLQYSKPDTVQTIGGGTHWKWLGLARGIRKNAHYGSKLIQKTGDELEIDFVSGCSMLLSRTALMRVGLLDDAFFAYWEDADWCERARRNGLTLAYSIRSVIYHKLGQSATSSRSSYLSTLNCFRFYRKNFPFLLPVIVCTRLCSDLLIGLKNSNHEYIKGALRAYTRLVRGFNKKQDYAYRSPAFIPGHRR